MGILSELKTLGATPVHMADLYTGKVYFAQKIVKMMVMFNNRNIKIRILEKKNGSIGLILICARILAVTSGKSFNYKRNFNYMEDSTGLLPMRDVLITTFAEFP